MARNKVILKGETLIDLTSDTVTAATLGKGATAHDKSGNQIVGTMDGSDLIDSLIDRSITSISSNVETVGNYVFSNCTSLTSVSFPNATTVEYCAFYECTSLTSVSFPNATTVEYYAFYGCTSLTSVDLPNVTSIDSLAFYGCTSLTSVDLPNVTSIDSLAFGGCRQLETLILRSLTVATLLDTDVFNSTQIESGTGYIYVPAGLIDQYKTATNWTEYADQFRAIED